MSIGVHTKDVIYLGDTPLKVISMEGHERAQILVGDKTFDITDQEATEVLPGVMVYCGAPVAEKRDRADVLPRLCFEAPPSVVILRKELYERSRR